MGGTTLSGAQLQGKLGSLCYLPLLPASLFECPHGGQTSAPSQDPLSLHCPSSKVAPLSPSSLNSQGSIL